MLGLALLLLAQTAAQSLIVDAPAASSVRIVPRCETQPAGDDIVVCGRREEAERYRLPIRPDGFDKKGATDSVSRERHRLLDEVDAGINSCSNVGPGGQNGCFSRSVKRRCEQEGCGIAF